LKSDRTQSNFTDNNQSSLDYFFTIQGSGEAEFKDRGSRFIGYAFPMDTADDFKKKLQEFKKMHPKAVHHCFAWRLGITGDSFRVSDDGEPSGSAGRPILGQIDSRDLTNAGVIVVRYFGGTLLGVPGLIQAYKTATSLALQTTPRIQRDIFYNYRLEFEYNLLNDVMRLVKQCGCTIIKQELQLFSVLEIGVAKNREQELLFRLQDLRSLTWTRV
jgi:uncharacterized YigZ family protein